MTSTAVQLYRQRRGGRGLYKRQEPVQRSSGIKRRTLPEYLEREQINALLRSAEDGRARLCMLLQWRAGLRISEAVNVTPADLTLDGDRPTLKVRQGKGGKDRIVPVHGELHAALRAILDFAHPEGRLVPVSRGTAWRWLKAALKKAEENGEIPRGRKVGTHTLRHSCARHWLASGIQINLVQRWLGHSNMSTTLIYLQILPDPWGDISKVP